MNRPLSVKKDDRFESFLDSFIRAELYDLQTNGFDGKSFRSYDISCLSKNVYSAIRGICEKFFQDNWKLIEEEDLTLRNGDFCEIDEWPNYNSAGRDFWETLQGGNGFSDRYYPAHGVKLTKEAKKLDRIKLYVRNGKICA
jgi:hypothetical protein